jgi:hypothetical protein
MTRIETAAALRGLSAALQTRSHTVNDTRTDSPFLIFWGTLNAALALRDLPQARYGEARDFFASGYVTKADAVRVAATWSADQ